MEVIQIKGFGSSFEMCVLGLRTFFKTVPLVPCFFFGPVVHLWLQARSPAHKGTPFHIEWSPEKYRFGVALPRPYVPHQ